MIVRFSPCHSPRLLQIHPAVQRYTLAARPLAKTIEQLEHQVMSPPVVATTCLSVDQYVIGHPRFPLHYLDLSNLQSPVLETYIRLLHCRRGITNYSTYVPGPVAIR